MRRLRRAHLRSTQKRKKLRNRALAAGTGAVIAFGASSALSIPPPTHLLTVAHDADGDLLSNKEEQAIGYAPFRRDQNANGVADGVDLAKCCAAAIDALPLGQELEDPNKIHKRQMFLRGLEWCDICGESVNMGYWEIINPRLGMTVQLYDIELHYLHHGSFSHQGSLHEGRADVPALLRALELRWPLSPDDHQLPLTYTVETAGRLAEDANDLDADLLADSEELALGSNLYDADQNENLTPDGPEFAKRCAAVIDALEQYAPQETPGPGLHKVAYLVYGLEFCDVCGEPVNMGYWEVVNPKLHTSVQIYDIALHYMRHGSLSHHGLTFEGGLFHAGRVNPAALGGLLEMPRTCGDLGTLFQPADLDRDCKVDFTDVSHFGQQWLASTDPQG